MSKTRTETQTAQGRKKGYTRRKFVKTVGVSAAAVVFAPAVLRHGTAHAAGRTIKIGHVSPKTGPVAAFAEADDFIEQGIRKAVGKGIRIGGTVHPIEIITKDSQSNPNRAAEVAAKLILSDKIDLMVAAGTPDNVNPVSDQCELNEVPCVSTNAPWQAYFFGRGGKPPTGFEWTYHFFWGLEDVIGAFTNMWNTLDTNRVVGGMFSNDVDGNAWGDAKHGMPAALKPLGFKLIDPGRYQPLSDDYTAQISAFKKAKVEILTGVFIPPDFSTFWKQAKQQGFRPKIATVGKALLFPASVQTLGDLCLGLSSEVWWSPSHPFSSGLTGQTSAQLGAEWEAKTGRQWTQPLGFQHALFEVAIDVLKRTRDVNDPRSILKAIVSTNYNSMVGPVSWGKGSTANPVKNVSKTPLVGGQWRKGRKFPYDLVIVNNKSAPNIPVAGKFRPLSG